MPIAGPPPPSLHHKLKLANSHTMATNGITKMLLRQYAKAAAEYHRPNGNLFFHFDENNVTTCYVLYTNFDPEALPHYAGAEFIVEFQVPPEYPRKPPRFKVLTPNGVYACDGKVCVSTGEFHENERRHALQHNKISNFAFNLMGGFVDDSPPELRGIQSGVGIMVHISNTEKKRLGDASRLFNLRNFPGLAAAFDRIRLEVGDRLRGRG